MSLSMDSMVYSRRGRTGTVQIRGVVDIFEAQQLHAIALRAFQDEKALKVKVNLAAVNRLDVSAIQILTALKQSLDAEGRGFSLEAVPDMLCETLKIVDKLYLK